MPIAQIPATVSSLSSKAQPTLPAITPQYNKKHACDLALQKGSWHMTHMGINAGLHAVIGATSAAIGYGMFDHNNSTVPGIDIQQFAAAMALGSAIISILPYAILSATTDPEYFVNYNSTRIVTNMIIAPAWHLAMGFASALSGAAILGLLHNPQQIHFATCAGEVGGAIAGICILFTLAICGSMDGGCDFQVKPRPSV